MTFISFISLILFGLAVELKSSLGEPRSCIRYMTEETFISDKACLKYAFDGITMEAHLRECPEGLVCDLSAWNGNELECTKNYTGSKLYPGEYCECDRDCYSGHCVNNQCQGNSIDKGCLRSIDCHTGLYCLEGVCLDAGKEGDNCNKRNRCKANLICDYGKCIKIGSKSLNARAEFFAACETFHITNETCRNGYKLQNKGSRNPERCNYINASDDSFQTPPQCGANKQGDLYCSLGEEDVNLKDVFFLHQE